ncbi:MAG TPA: 4'-phosphopantetheinyl transferase superfamily protein [Propionibacteriaceae bacterium]
MSRPLFSGLVPSWVEIAETFHDTAESTRPEEVALVTRAVPARRREFLLVRECAHRALLALGTPAPVIGRLPGGGPAWPAGVVGSLTHCRGFGAAAVAAAAYAIGVGIDAEPHQPLPHGVLEEITGAVEQASLRRLHRSHPDRHWDRLLFCAKEAVYKVWSPLTERWLGFGDVVCELSPDGTFVVTIGAEQDPPPDLAVLTGRWAVREGLALTTLVLPTRS